MRARSLLRCVAAFGLVPILGCGGAGQPSATAAPTSVVSDAARIWCDTEIGSVAGAATSLKLYGSGASDPSVVVTRFDGSNQTMRMSEVLPLLVLGSQVGKDEPTTMRVTRGMRDAWVNVDREGYERACAAAFELR